MAFTVPAINLTACGEWTPQQADLYQRLPEWFIKSDRTYRKTYGEWTKMFGRTKFEQNKGTNVKLLLKEPPPVLRQHAFGSALCGPAKVDITQYRDREVPMYMVRHKFQSPVFCWCSSFYDFLRDNVQTNLKFVQDAQKVYEQVFYRSALFHHSPTVMLADGIDTTALGTGYSAGVHYTAPVGVGNEAGTASKTLNYLETLAPLVGNPGNLSMRTVLKGVNILSEDLGAMPYQNGTPKENSPLNEKYLLVTSAEAYDQFADDPLYKENRPSDEDAIRHGFHGLIRDRVTTVLHSYPLRAYRADNGDMSWPQPQTIIEDTTHPQFGRTVPNPLYRAAQFEFAFLMGYQPMDIVDVGAPPTPFSSHGFNWNGEPMLTDKFLIECLNSEAEVVKEYNTEGEYLKLFSTLALGIAPVNPQNALVIMFKRKRDVSTFLF